MGFTCTREYVFGGVYLIAWIALAVGCVHYKWFWFYPDPDNNYYYCHAGLWQVCCPEPPFFSEGSKNSDSRSLNDEFEECVPFSDTEDVDYPPNWDKDDFFDGQLWVIRAFMLAASVMPLVALGSRFSGSYIHALIFMIISGLFGAVAIVSTVFFAFEYFADEDSWTDSYFPSARMGPSFVFVLCGTGAIWIFTFIDLIMIGKNFEISDRNNESTDTVENPYAEDVTNVKETTEKAPEEPPVYEQAPEEVTEDVQKDAEL